jgi:hypothetical protein
MASHGPDIHSKSSGKAQNQGGRPRKHITVKEAKERKVVKQKQKRLLATTATRLKGWPRNAKGTLIYFIPSSVNRAE